jgi:hypothetical protein
MLNIFSIKSALLGDKKFLTELLLAPYSYWLLAPFSFWLKFHQELKIISVGKAFFYKVDACS